MERFHVYDQRGESTLTMNDSKYIWVLFGKFTVSISVVTSKAILPKRDLPVLVVGTNLIHILPSMAES